MAFQALQEELQARRESAAEAVRRERTFAEIRIRLLKRSAEAAKAVVAVEPEARHLAEVLVLVPDLARIEGEEHAKLRRPAVACVEFEAQGAETRRLNLELPF